MHFQVLHGAERGEPVALLLSPLKPAFKNLSRVDATHSGSQFTFFLAAPLQSFCQMAGLTFVETDAVSLLHGLFNLYDNSVVPCCWSLLSRLCF